MTDNAAPGLNALHLRFGRRVRFVMVNVREAHPGRAIPQPGTLDAKMAHAMRLRELHGFEFDVAVDDLNGTLHRALGAKPNAASVYQLAVDRLRVSPDRICFVSSNGWDAFSARAFGFRVVWCNRFGQAPERIPALPDGEIRTLSALPDIAGA